MFDSSYTLFDPKDKGTWTKELSVFRKIQELQTHEKLKCNSDHSYFDALSFFLPHKYLMKWVQTKAI